MKNIFLAFLVCGLTLLSCSSDDSTNETPPVTGETPPKETNPESETTLQPLSITTVEEALTVTGATKKTGTPPAPNGDLTFDSSASIANTTEGFFITTSTNAVDDIAGIYLQLLDENKNPIDSYLDIPASSFDKGTLPNPGAPTNTKESKIEKNTSQININFKTKLPRGTFCYFICVYNESGISQPSEVCVIIEDWGGEGSSILFGSWVKNGEVPGLVKKNNTLNFKMSGEFTYDHTSEYNGISGDGSIPVLNFSFEGNWSYNASSKIITLVSSSLKTSGTYEGENIDEEKNIFEEGEILFSGKVFTENGIFFEGNLQSPFLDFIGQYTR